jgi:tetratricopeptide (TPR) repeat protein
MINVPPELKPFVDRVRQLGDENRYDEAVAAAREAVSRFPDLAVVHNNLGCSLANLELYDEAAGAFERAVALTTKNREAGIVTPPSYPQEPARNLRAVRELLAGKETAVPVPDRQGRLQREPAGAAEPFPQRVFAFVTSTSGMLLGGILTTVSLYLRRARPEYFPPAVSVSCLIVLFCAWLSTARGRV